MATGKVQDTWRTVRFFLDEDGVFEVMFDSTGKTTALRCNCPVFGEKGGCPHTGFVSEHHRSEVWEYVRLRIDADQEQWRLQVLNARRVEVV